MDPNAYRPQVIIRHCDAYDVERIREIVREGLETLDLRPQGRTLVKPNLVCAGPKFEHAHTRPEFTEGVVLALQDRDDGQVTEMAVGERCGITIPTRMTFAQSGHDDVVKRLGVKKYYFEEEPQVEIPLSHPGRLRNYLFTPEPVAKADFFVNCPKFKAHPWTTVTFGNKAYIGLQDDRHRLIDHDAKLNEKIADLQYILQPKFLAIDAITAGEGRMLTPIPRDLNLIIMGNNQCAFDAVCCAVIGVDPYDVDHIRMAHERGFGPLVLKEIEVSGDVTLEDARARSTGFDVGLIRVEKYFEGTNISAYAGPPPASEGHDYCWGGCPGAMEEAIEILRKVDERADEGMPRLHIVFGNYDGPIDFRGEENERVVFIGDCAEWQGQLGDQTVAVENLYRDRSTLDPYTVEPQEMMDKVLKVKKAKREHKNLPYLRLTGCPVSVSEQLMALVDLGGFKSPMNDWPSIKAYFTWKSAIAMKRLVGHRYQVLGEAERGDAKPEGMLPQTTPAE
ncbi:MAG: DUF362 domain-containing protein [Myxococcales bacterium]|nr:DUF362 domain-containing protein [Myxococcales bacterium]